MYVYCNMFGGEGFNDILAGLNHLINYCVKFNRILLFDTTRSPYKINWSDYFTFNAGCNVICDNEKIKLLITDNLIIYPPYLNGKMKNILHLCIFETAQKYSFIFNISLIPSFKYFILFQIKCLAV